MQFGLLGHLEVLDSEGRAVELGGGQSRLVVAVLLAASGRVVPTERIIDAVWGASPPLSAANTLQSYVSRVRRSLEGAEPGGGGRLRHEPPGYLLECGTQEVDFRRFEQLADAGRRMLESGDPAGAVAALTEADALWRGPALAEFADHEVARGLAARLEDRRIAATEDRITAELTLGRHASVAAELSELVSRHPLRESLAESYALALYRSGRQAEALRALEAARRILRDELGVDPGPSLRELEARILDHDPTLDAATASAGVVAARGSATATAPPAGVDAPTGVGPVPLVSRTTERSELLGLLEASRTSTRFAVLEGEPGIGKTRLCEEIAAAAAAEGRQVMWGRSLEGGAAPAFWPWLDVLRSFDVDPGSALGTLVAPRVEGHVAPIAGAVSFQLVDEVAAALEEAARARPLLVVLDDLQWADPASLELLAFLTDRLVDAPLLFLITVRELEVGRRGALVDALAALSRGPGNRRIHLRGISVTGTADLLAALTGAEVSSEVARELHDRAGGNPFFVTELARLIGPAALADVESVRALDVPGGVRDVVRRRLGLLPEGTVEVLGHAAVIGRDVELGLLSRSAGRPLDECADALEPALVQRLLVDVEEAPGTFRFSHALVREVVADDLSSLRRARIHLRVADAIEEVAGDADDTAEILAEHLWAAAALGVGERAAAALERAAEVAVRRSAYETAEDLLLRAVPLRRGAGASAGHREAELLALCRLFEVQRALQGYNAVAASPMLPRARELATTGSRSDLTFDLLWTEWSGHCTACRFDEAERLVDDIVRLLGHDEDPYIRAAIRGVQGVTHVHLGRFARAAEALDAVGEALVELGQAAVHGVGAEMLLISQCFRWFVHGLMADRDDVDERFGELALGLEDPYARIAVLMFHAVTASSLNQPEAVIELGREAMDADPDMAFPFFSGIVRLCLGPALIRLGHAEEGLEQLRIGRDAYASVDQRSGLAHYLANQAEALAGLGRIDEARAALSEARDELDRYGEQWPVTLIDEADAVVAAATGAPQDAVRERFETALAVARAQSAGGLERRVLDTAAAHGIDLGPPACG